MGHFDHSAISKHLMMTVSRTNTAAKASRSARKEAEDAPIELGELPEMLGYALKRAQLKIFEDFLYSGRRTLAKLRKLPECVDQIGQYLLVPYRPVVKSVNEVEIRSLRRVNYAF